MNLGETLNLLIDEYGYKAVLDQLVKSKPQYPHSVSLWPPTQIKRLGIRGRTLRAFKGLSKGGYKTIGDVVDAYKKEGLSAFTSIKGIGLQQAQLIEQELKDRQDIE